MIKQHLLVTIGLLMMLSPARSEESWKVTEKAWAALDAKNWNEVERLANTSINQWGESARKTNNNLSKMPSAEKAGQYPNLNQIATILWLKGEALRLKGDRDGALAAYYTLLADYNFGQTWDNQGWYWQPSKAARDRIAELLPDNKIDISLDTKPLSKKLKLPGKKGICFTLRKDGKQGSHTENIPRVAATNSYWNYSWGTQRVDTQPDELEFMPMIWGAWSKEGLAKDIEKHIKPQIKAGTAKRILGFNEPDKKEQANMPYTEALKYWPILEELGLQLCSPACANPLSDIDESTQGVRGTWMRDFMKEADKRKYRIDYIGVHWYGGPSPVAFKERMVQVYESYGRRPLLISEFAIADWGAKTPGENEHTRSAVLEFMKEVLPWLEAQNWIAGYSWFSFEHDDPNGTCSALFNEKGQLNALGKFYQSVTTENPAGNQQIQ